MINNNKGAALALVILIMAVLSILGVSLLGIGLSETRQVAFQEKKMEAYYIARSGADATAENLLVNLDKSFLDALELNPGEYVESESNTLGNGTFDVKAKMENGAITIESEGTIPNTTFGDVSAVAKLTLFNMQDRAIISVGNINLNSIKVLNGDVESTSGTVTGMPNQWVPEGEKYNSTGRILPPVTVPNLDLDDYDPFMNGTAQNFSVPNNTVDIIPGNYKYSNITASGSGSILTINCSIECNKLSAGNGATIIFDTNGGNIDIVTDVLDIKGGFEIVGPGQVFLFITSNSIESTIKTSDSGTNTSDQLIIFLDKDVELSLLTGSRQFFGHIYGPEAKINLESGSTVNGSIIGEIFAASGNPSVYYEPLLRTPPNYELYTSGASRYRRGYWN